MNMKERIHWINETAKADWERAKGMLDMLNDMYDTDLRFLNKSVVISDSRDGDTAAFYANCHDMETWLS